MNRMSCLALGALGLSILAAAGRDLARGPEGGVAGKTVIDPRGVLSELGVGVPADTEVRVWDSTAEIRYMVLPERPAGTEGMTEAELAELVTRDAMIGVARVQSPAGAAR